MPALILILYLPYTIAIFIGWSETLPLVLTQERDAITVGMPL
jgi:hypothetical protein